MAQEFQVIPSSVSRFFKLQKLLVVLVVILVLLVTGLSFYLYQPQKGLGQTIICPVNKEFCQKGHEAFKDNQYIGWGGEVNKDTEIKAVFKGKVFVTSVILRGGEKFLILYLGGEKGIARYIFSGKVVKSGEVEKGDVIGRSTGEPVSPYVDSEGNKNNSFVFSYAKEYDRKELESQNYPVKSAVWLKVGAEDFVER